MLASFEYIDLKNFKYCFLSLNFQWECQQGSIGKKGVDEEIVFWEKVMIYMKD